MTRDEIVRMARQVWDEGTVDPFHNGYWTLTQQELERFAALVAAAERDALRAELREATAATNDPAVNNLRTLPESIRMLRAERNELLGTLEAVDTALRLPGVTAEEAFAYRSPIRLAIRAAIAKATGETT